MKKSNRTVSYEAVNVFSLVHDIIIFSSDLKYSSVIQANIKNWINLQTKRILPPSGSITINTIIESGRVRWDSDHYNVERKVFVMVIGNDAGKQFNLNLMTKRPDPHFYLQYQVTWGIAPTTWFERPGPLPGNPRRGRPIEFRLECKTNGMQLYINDQEVYLFTEVIVGGVFPVIQYVYFQEYNTDGGFMNYDTSVTRVRVKGISLYGDLQFYNHWLRATVQPDALGSPRPEVTANEMYFVKEDQVVTQVYRGEGHWGWRPFDISSVIIISYFFIVCTHS